MFIITKSKSFEKLFMESQVVLYGLIDDKSFEMSKFNYKFTNHTQCRVCADGCVTFDYYEPKETIKNDELDAYFLRFARGREFQLSRVTNSPMVKDDPLGRQIKIKDASFFFHRCPGCRILIFTNTDVNTNLRCKNCGQEHNVREARDYSIRQIASSLNMKLKELLSKANVAT